MVDGWIRRQCVCKEFVHSWTSWEEVCTDGHGVDSVLEDRCGSLNICKRNEIIAMK